MKTDFSNTALYFFNRKYNFHIEDVAEIKSSKNVAHFLTGLEA